MKSYLLYKTEHITPNYMYLLSVRVYDCIDTTIYQHVLFLGRLENLLSSKTEAKCMHAYIAHILHE
mgnify:CR=1 FL=1